MKPGNNKRRIEFRHREKGRMKPMEVMRANKKIQEKKEKKPEPEVAPNLPPEQQEEQIPQEEEQYEQQEQIPQNVNQPVQPPEPKKIENPTLEKLRDEIKSRGPGEIIRVAKEFKDMDTVGNKLFEFGDFYKVMNKLNYGLNRKEIEELYDMVEPDESGDINYNDFLLMVRDEMNDERTKAVVQAFYKMDIDNSGIVNYSDIKNFFNCKTHKDVLSGEKTEEEVFNDFIQNFDLHHEFKKGIRDKKVSREEFIEFYDNISMSYDNDDEFINMVANSWGLSNNKIKRKNPEENQEDEKEMNHPKTRRTLGDKFNKVGVPENAPFGTDKAPMRYETSSNPIGKNNPYVVDKGNEVLQRFRNEIISRGTRGVFSLRRALMIADEKGNKQISIDDFAKLCDDYRYELTDEDIDKIFKTLDKKGNGYINYDDLLRGLVGPRNPRRQEIIREVFDKLDIEGNGLLDPNFIKNNFRTKDHPDIITGKKNEEKVLSEFLDTFEYHFYLLDPNREKDSKITLEEFMEYYNYISMSIPNDHYFETLLTNIWDLDEKPNYAIGYRDGENRYNFGKGGWRRELNRNIIAHDSGEKNAEPQPEGNDEAPEE